MHLVQPSEIFFYLQRPEDILEELHVRHSKYRKYGLNLGPTAVVVGPPESPESAFLVIDDVIYKVESPSAALDLSFKAKFALDAAYPKETICEWLFLQRAVYGIVTPHDRDVLKGRVCALVEEYAAFQ